MTHWTVLPLRAFEGAKQRLATRLTPAERRVLARLMLHDMLDTLLGLPAAGQVAVLTADAEAAAFARHLGVSVIREQRPGAGLNAAVADAAAGLAQAGVERLLVLPADAPGVTAGELVRVLAGHPGGHSVSLVPAHDGRGTNALLLSPPGALMPAFGGGSFARHLTRALAAGLPVHTLTLPGLALDIDRPQDLERLCAAHAGTRSARWWRGICAAHACRSRRDAGCATAPARP